MGRHSAKKTLLVPLIPEEVMATLIVLVLVLLGSIVEALLLAAKLLLFTAKLLLLAAKLLLFTAEMLAAELLLLPGEAFFSELLASSWPRGSRGTKRYQEEQEVTRGNKRYTLVPLGTSCTSRPWEGVRYMVLQA